MNMNKKCLRAAAWFPLIATILFSACNTTKNLKEGEYLYTGGEVTLAADTSISKENRATFEEHLEELLTPKPNKSIFGWRYKLGFNNMAGDSVGKNFIRKWFKKIGEEPVLLSDVNREYNENIIRNRMENLGFFNATVASDTIILKKKLAKVEYTATPNKIYLINSVTFEVDSTTELGRDINKSKDKTLLNVGKNYSLDVIMNERDRIDNELKNIGYYYFSPDYILVQVDSTNKNNKVNLYVTIKAETPDIAKKPSTINNIYVYPNYTLTNTGYQTAPRHAPLIDSNYYFIDRQNIFRPKVITNHIFFKRGDIYNRPSHNKSLNHLVNLNSFKFVKNNFVDAKDKPNALDVYYYLTPLPKKSLRIEVLGKTASVYNGSEVSANWQLRNAFRGAEMLNINVFGGYELQTGGNVNLNSTYYRYGAEASLIFPRIISPFPVSVTRKYIPRTYVKTGFEILNRTSAYSLRSINANFGYTWKESDKKQHDFTLMEIIYVQPRNITPEYQAQMDTVPTLKHAIEPQFSFGPNYNFTYTNTMDNTKKHTIYFKGGLDLSANTLGLIQGANINAGKQHKIFDAYYSQYIKTEFDFRHYMKITTNSQLASRVNIGYSYSYGNSRSLPYLKQFFVGGPNSLRAFRARSIGPGSLAPQNLGANNFYADQTGDYKLEINTEFRAKLASIIHWAAFLDAGNVWLQNEDPNKSGAKFSKDFLSEMAIGGGLGLRFDFTFLILRTDFTIPLRVPYLDKSERWVIKDIDIGNRAWRKNNLMFNLAIGYPF